MAICAFFWCVNFRAGQFLSKFRKKHINAVLIVAHILLPHIFVLKISSNKVFKVYTIFSKQKLFRIIVYYQLVSILYLRIDTNVFSSFPCCAATEQDSPS